MKIIRNGIEIELTNEEIREAHEIKKKEYLIEDICCKLEEMEIEMSEQEIEDVAGITESTLGNHDSYWECYWLSIEYAIENVRKEA